VLINTGHGYVPKHRWLWEHAHGPIPAGMTLKCKGSRLDTDPANWELVPRALIAERVGNPDSPPGCVRFRHALAAGPMPARTVCPFPGRQQARRLPCRSARSDHSALFRRWAAR
jgi:hypothetical protein